MQVILGGTTGLGWNLALQLREAGQEVFVIGRSYDPMKHGDGMLADLSDRSEAHRVAAWFENDDASDINGLYWVIGTGYKGNFMDQENLAEMMDINLTHPMIVCQGVLRKLLAQNRQCELVIISSTTGVKVRNDETTYATSKGAQIVLANNLRAELHRLANEKNRPGEPERQSTVRITVFEPGGMKTPFWGKPEDRPAAYDERFMDSAAVAAFMLDYLQLPDTEREKMIEQPELEAWLAQNE